MSINDGLSTTDAPPDDLMKSLQPAKSTERNPLRPPVEKPSKNANPPQTPGPPMYPHFPMLPYGYYPPYGPSTPLPGVGYPLPPATTTAQPNIEIFSSSPQSDVDFVERLVQYLDWLSRHSPQQSTLFSEAKDMLVLAGHTFETIGMITDEKLVSMGIVEGIGLQIKSKIGKFKRLHAKGHV